MEFIFQKQKECSMENTNYLVTTSDEDMYYLLIDKKYTPQESLKYFLQYDIKALLEFIATVQSSSTLVYYWREIESLDISLDYCTQSQELLFSFVGNDNTPQEIIHDVVSNNTVLKDDKLGVEPYVAHMFSTHINSTQELMEIYHDNFDNHEDIQDDFDDLMLAAS